MKNGLRYGTYTINGKKGTVPTQAITSVNLQHAEDADVPKFNFGTNILDIIEPEPQRLIDDIEYRRERIQEIKQQIKNNRNKICLLAIKGIKSTFRINFSENEFLINFQIKCGFQLIRVFLRLNRKAQKEMDNFRKIVASKKKTFVACIDENLRPKKFEYLYLECIKNNDDIVSFFGRKVTEDNSPNFAFLIERNQDNIIRFSSMISKTNNNMINSVARNLLGFDCYSFSQKTPTDTGYFELVALEGFYFNTLTKDSPLICALTQDNLFTSSGRFKRNKQSAFLPIYIHDMVRLNELFKTLHIRHSREELIALFRDSL